MNEEKSLRIRDLISEKDKHLIWRDECHDDFLILRFGEVFRYTKNILRLYVWGNKALTAMRNNRVGLQSYKTDDAFHSRC